MAKFYVFHKSFICLVNPSEQYKPKAVCLLSFSVHKGIGNSHKYAKIPTDKHTEVLNLLSIRHVNKYPT